ncbi:YchJ family protein [Bordetella sp. FB-8]|uniref:YchJ family protein n=1 Tax=Bordetella sp. FB-8 TaxID=1159870 RepID=UPI0009DB23DE|nr:YchJ family metal-binding protein [Bordetella sp. FB-8]
MSHRAGTAAACPCGTGVAYSACCSRWHEGKQSLQAPTAEALMRSRYAAFVQDRLDYLLQTWHPDTRPLALDPNPRGIKWLGLRVVSHIQQDPDHVTVEFVARRRDAGRAARLHEVSRFVRLNGRWFYVDGEFPA